MIKMVLFQTPVAYSLQFHDNLAKTPCKIPHVITENIYLLSLITLERTVVYFRLNVLLNRLQLNVCFKGMVLYFLHRPEDKYSMN